MENSFNKLGEPQQETPKGIKKGVVKRISAIALFSDLFGLFFRDFGELAKTVFEKNNSSF